MNLATVRRTVALSGRDIRLDLPADPELILRQALVVEQSGNSPYDPYWSLLWDAAPKTAELIWRHAWPTGLAALELGCGVGLAGIAAALAGLQVTFSDRVPEAVDLAIDNARANGVSHVSGLVLDWNAPTSQQFDVLLASDVLYDRSGHAPLLHVLRSMLADDGVVWIGDVGRATAPDFIDLAAEQGWLIELRDSEGHLIPRFLPLSFQLIKLRRGAAEPGQPLAVG